MVTCADVLTVPNGPLPDPDEAITKEEAENPALLPFTGQPSNDNERRLRQDLLKIIEGREVEEAKTFLTANSLPDSEYAVVAYQLAKWVKGTAPNKNDIKHGPNIQEVLTALKADDDWKKLITETYQRMDPPLAEQRIMMVMAIIRFRAVVDWGYKHKNFPRPYWVLPSNEEIQTNGSVSQ